MKKANVKRGFHKKISITLASVAIFSMLLTGTFAWFSGTIQAENVFTGIKTSTLPPVALHDDFENPNKDIYVENFGDTPVYVRVKLSEVWDLTTNKKPNPMPITTKWHIHSPGLVVKNGRIQLDYQATTDNDIFHDNFIWSWGKGRQKDYIKADGSSPDNVYQDKQADIDAMKLSDPSRVGRTPLGDIICVDEYISPGFNTAAYVGWIYDVDGWAYWSRPLKKDEVTSLLLDGVETKDMDDYDFYYVIDVKMEAVNIADLQNMWIEGKPSVDNQSAQTEKATTQGIAALNIIKAIPIS